MIHSAATMASPAAKTSQIQLSQPRLRPHVNTVTFNVVAWVTAIAMIALTLVLTYMSLFPNNPQPS